MKARARTAAVAAAVAAIACGAAAETTVQGDKGPSTQTTPYLVPVAPGVRTVSIFTVGDTVNPKLDGAAPYRFVGIPDGLGAFDNGDDTFTLLMNHELGGTSGVARAHGSAGAFVSAWRIEKDTLRVQAVNDLVRTVMTWNPATQAYVAGTSAFARLCSADLPAQTAFHDPASGLGTPERLFMSGEENGNNGRAFAHVCSGANTGVSYELPKLGKQSWENQVACPFPQAKTIVIGTDDSTPGQVLVYVGTKVAAGNEVQKAGLTNGKLYGVVANNARTEDRTTGVGLAKGVAGAFTMVELPDQALAGANTESASDTLLVTEFLRPEDGCWDPANPADFYFVTTDQFSSAKAGTGSTVGNSRLWRLRFGNLANPESGGTVTMLLDGSEAGQMYDQICSDRFGHLFLQEDVGGQNHNGKIWQYDIATGALTLLAKHDPGRFGDLVGTTVTPATAPFNNDEESSGIIDASEFLGPGWFLLDDQAHYSAGDTELDQGGQLLAMYVPDAVPAPTIVSPVAASATTSSVGQTVGFSVQATTLGDGLITYAWSFGDGGLAAGDNVSHAFAAPGAYTVVATATHVASGRQVQSQVVVNVQRPMGPLFLAVGLNFAKTGKDTLTLTGDIPLPAGFDVAGKQVTVDVGGVQRNYTLAGSGASPKSPTDSFKLAVRRTKAGVPAQRSRFTLTLRNASLAATIEDEGLVDETIADEPVAVPVTLTFAGRTTTTTLDLIYTAVAGKKGTAK